MTTSVAAYRMLAAAALMNVAGAALGAEQDGPWFGVAAPDAARYAPESIYAQPDFTSLPLLSTAARSATADIDAAELFGYVRDQVDISVTNRAEGELIWGRVAGRSGDRMVTEYIRKKFVEFGLQEVSVDSVSMPPQVWPVKAELTLIASPRMGKGSKDYRFVSAMPQPASPPTSQQGLTAELVYVGYGRDIDIAGKKLAGKGAVLRGRPAQGGYSTARGIPDKLAEAGAAFVIIIFDLPIDVQTYNGALTGRRVPTFAIADYEGRFIEDVMARASTSPVKARVKLTNVVEERPTSNIVGQVKGTSDEYAIVIAHHDSYFYGANDNASGVAAMLGLAKHFASLKEPPRRTHIFVATGGHHGGGYPGSTKFATDHLDIRDRTAIVLNSEHMAAVQTIEYTDVDKATWGSAGGLLVANTETPKFGSVVPSNPLLLDLFAQSLARYGVTMLSTAWDVGVGDLTPFRRRDYPVARIIEVGHWYHTTGDILSAVSPVGLERSARAYADFLHDVDERPLSAIHDSP